MTELKHQVEEINSGIRKRGNIEEIAEFSDELKKSLKTVSKNKDIIDKFDFWKPRKDDEEKDIKDRTAKAACIEDKQNELLKFVSRLEELIYSKFMLNFNPCYFDARNFSVSLEKKDGEFEMKFSSPEKEYRNALKRRFKIAE